MEGRKFPYFKFGTWEFCAYCGFTPQNMDHVFPMAYASEGDRKWGATEHIGPQTPACRDCNGRLGARSFYSFEDRCEWISGKWSARAAKAAARWEQIEILQLKGALRNYVVLKQIERAALFQRWKWFGSEEYYLNIENLLYERSLCHEDVKFHANYSDYFSSTLTEIARCLNTREARKRHSQDDYKF